MKKYIAGFDRRAIFHIAAITFSLLIVAPLTIMVVDSRVPVIITQSEMVPSVVFPGQTVTIRWTAIELRACDGVVRRRFVDAARVIHEIEPAPTIYRARLSDNPTFSRDVTIPAGMAIGPGATYGGTRHYFCNPLQQWFQGMWGIEIRAPIAEIRFTVIAK